MAENRGTNVDAETRAELSKIQSDLHLTIINTISEGFKGLRSDLTEFFNKDFDHVNEKLQHFQDNHREHYQNDKDRRKDIDNLEKRIAEIQIEHKTEDKFEEKTDRKKELSMGKVVLVCGIITVVISGIAVLVTLLVS